MQQEVVVLGDRPLRLRRPKFDAGGELTVDQDRARHRGRRVFGVERVAAQPEDVAARRDRLVTAVDEVGAGLSLASEQPLQVVGEEFIVIVHQGYEPGSSHGDSAGSGYPDAIVVGIHSYGHVGEDGLIVDASQGTTEEGLTGRDGRDSHAYVASHQVTQVRRRRIALIVGWVTPYSLARTGC